MLWVDKKYLRLISSRFRNSKWKDDNLLNHSCPYCGDSKKNKTKARGFFYRVKNDMFFKCHNCGTGQSFANFIKFIDPKLSQRTR